MVAEASALSFFFGVIIGGFAVLGGISYLFSLFALGLIFGAISVIGFVTYLTMLGVLLVADDM